MALNFVVRGIRRVSWGQKLILSINTNAEAVTLRAPFYRHTIPFSDITMVQALVDEGSRPGLLAWFVTGRAKSAQGLRLDSGGKARVEITTRNGRFYSVVVDTLDQAHQIEKALAMARREQ